MDKIAANFDGVMWLRSAADHRYLWVSPNFERETGLRDVVGRTVAEILPDDVAEHIRTDDLAAEQGMAGTGVTINGTKWSGVKLAVSLGVLGMAQRVISEPCQGRSRYRLSA